MFENLVNTESESRGRVRVFFMCLNSILTRFFFSLSFLSFSLFFFATVSVRFDGCDCIRSEISGMKSLTVKNQSCFYSYRTQNSRKRLY